tara:strand:+ start:11302 stop:11478 length:177 start_codon:yes stop_codon:yes gene_type:complete
MGMASGAHAHPFSNVGDFNVCASALYASRGFARTEVRMLSGMEGQMLALFGVFDRLEE